jgi:hypothetical protein
MGYSSQSGVVVVRTQTGPGVAATDLETAGVAVKLRSGSLAPNRELLVPDAEIGGGRDVNDAYLGTVSFSGDYEMYPRMDSLLTFLNAVLGTTTSATAGAVSTHTVVGSDANQLPFLSVFEQIGSGLDRYRYLDAVVNTLHLEADANGYLMATVGLIARDQTGGVAAVAGAEDLYDNGPLIVGTNVHVTLGGVTLPAKSFSIDINNNFEDDDFRLGSFFLGDLTPKRREITASVSLRHNDATLFHQATYGQASANNVGGLTTKTPLTLSMSTYESIPTSAPATPYSLALTLGKVILEPFAFAPSGDDILENDVAMRAVRPVAGTPIMTATLVNGVGAVA